MSKINRPFRPLTQLIKIEKHIDARLHLTNALERFVDARDDQLNHIYKQAREEGFKVARVNYDNELVKQKAKLEKLHKQQLLDQAKKHQGRVSTLKNEIDFLSVINADDNFLFEPQHKFLVDNWQQGWKWFSTWAFALIVFIATVPIPSELLAVLPDHIRSAIIAGVAISGWILRFINQSKPLPNAEGT